MKTSTLLLASLHLGCCRDRALLAMPPDSGVPLTSSSGASAVVGTWSTTRFESKGAFADVRASSVSLTLSTRDASCEDRKASSADRTIELTIPSGPENDFFVGHPVSVPVVLTGAGGVSAIPAAFAFVQLDPFQPDLRHLQGLISFEYAAGAESNAPIYQSSGRFDAPICLRESTVASMPHLDTDRTPVTGTIQARARSFPRWLAHLRHDGAGRTVIQLKGYTTRDAGCVNEQPHTPFLFGGEIGHGPDGKWLIGGAMPVEWKLQVATGEASERTLHGGPGQGWMQVDEVELGARGRVRGRMMASTSSEDEPAHRFEASGRFDAQMCETTASVAPL